MAVAGAGLGIWYSAENPRLRAAALGLVFPGAGLIAACSISSVLSFILSTALIQLVIFAWFGCGGITFPIALWTGTIVLGAALASKSVWEPAAPLWTAICVSGLAYITWSWNAANAKAAKKRHVRNSYLVDAVQQNQATATEPAPGTREVGETDLRFLQWILELALAGKDDWSYHDIIDQFQTSAIRYQLYEANMDLNMYQYMYVY